MTRLPRFFPFMLVGSGFVSVASASGLNVGDAFPDLRLKNQHENVVAIKTDTRLLLFAREKSASDIVNDYLEKRPPNFLEQNRAYFVADISGMPGTITRMFALPKMRKRGYDILLGEEEETLAFFPHKENLVTVIRLKGGLVERIDYVGTSTDLDKVLEYFTD